MKSVTLALNRWQVVLVAAVVLTSMGLYADTKVPIETDFYEFYLRTFRPSPYSAILKISSAVPTSSTL